MKYCSNCGKELADNAQTCPNCGFVFGNVAPVTGGTTMINDAPSFGYALLGFFIPLIGIILYFMWKPTTPRRAKSAGKGALVSIILSAVMYIIAIAVLGPDFFLYY